MEINDWHPDELVEVSPGVAKRAADCTAKDVEGVIRLKQERASLRSEIEALSGQLNGVVNGIAQELSRLEASGEVGNSLALVFIELAAIGVDLYGDGPDPEPESILAAKRAVFALQFDPFWNTLTNEDRRWLREKLHNEGGAFDRMVAGYESRSTRSVDTMQRKAEWLARRSPVRGVS
jgi:hypothetical protein